MRERERVSERVRESERRHTNLIRKTFTNANRKLALSAGKGVSPEEGRRRAGIHPKSMCELWHEKAATAAHSSQGQPNLIDVDVSVRRQKRWERRRRRWRASESGFGSGFGQVAKRMRMRRVEETRNKRNKPRNDIQTNSIWWAASAVID